MRWAHIKCSQIVEHLHDNNSHLMTIDAIKCAYFMIQFRLYEHSVYFHNYRPYRREREREKFLSLFLFKNRHEYGGKWIFASCFFFPDWNCSQFNGFTW